MGRENHHGTRRDFVEFIDKDNALGLERIDHELVVHNFVTHINRGSELFNSLLYHMDCAVYTGTESTGSRKNHLFHNIPFKKFSNSL